LISTATALEKTIRRRLVRRTAGCLRDGIDNQFVPFSNTEPDNNAISVIRCAYDYGYKDHPEKHNPASGLKCLRITKKDRPSVDPFTIEEAESLISRLHADWGEAIGNYDEFRFFTGLRPSEQIALLVTDCHLSKGIVSVTKARVLRRDKDRTKTQEDRNFELCPRGLEILKRHFRLRDEYVAAGKIRHHHLFFLEDGSPISDPEVTRWRWNESLQKLRIRQRGPYHARHSSVTWRLMLGKNLLWVAKQHGHSVEVMLRMYAAWIEGATDADIQAIKQAMEAGPALRTGTPIAKKIVINPLLSPEFGSSSASRKQGGDLSPEKASEKSGGEGGIRTEGIVTIKKLQEKPRVAVPSRPLNSPDFAVDLAIAEYH
jgi:integrase